MALGMSAYTPSQFQLYKTEDRQVDDLQRGVTGPLQQLQNLQPLNGVYLTSQLNSIGVAVPITFQITSNMSIVHNLGRPYIGWILARVQNVIGSDAPWLVEAAQDAGLNSMQISLTNGSNSEFTCDLWVY